MRYSLEELLAHYIEALGRDGPFASGVSLLETEFIPGLMTLTRYGIATRGELLNGDVGIDLLHDTCESILSGELGPSSARGDLLRLLGRLAYARLRRNSRRRNALPFDDVGPIVSGAREPEAAADLSKFASLLGLLQESGFRKAGGSLHLGRIGKVLRVPPKRLRRQVRELGRALGRNPEHEAFWLARLGECLTQLLRERIEEELPDLLPSGCRPRAARQRLLPILGQLAHCSAPDAKRDGLRLARRMARSKCFKREELMRAALLLAPDPFPVKLAQVEWLRAQGRAQDALEILSELGSGPETGSGRPRRAQLLALASARCLEALARLREASDVLEPLASVHRRDPLLAFNRMVLAEAAGMEERAAAARDDLRALPFHELRVSPVLRHKIRLRIGGSS
ncbi:MAG: hypothetical protein ACE5F1_04260 [Planctomycetota bacterium]